MGVLKMWFHRVQFMKETYKVVGVKDVGITDHNLVMVAISHEDTKEGSDTGPVDGGCMK